MQTHRAAAHVATTGGRSRIARGSVAAQAASSSCETAGQEKAVPKFWRALCKRAGRRQSVWAGSAQGCAALRVIAQSLHRGVSDSGVQRRSSATAAAAFVMQAARQRSGTAHASAAAERCAVAAPLHLAALLKQPAPRVAAAPQWRACVCGSATCAHRHVTRGFARGVTRAATRCRRCAAARAGVCGLLYRCAAPGCSAAGVGGLKQPNKQPKAPAHAP